MCIDFSSDGNLVAVGVEARPGDSSNDKTGATEIWSLEDDARVATTARARSPTASVAFVPVPALSADADGIRYAIASIDLEGVLQVSALLSPEKDATPGSGQPLRAVTAANAAIELGSDAHAPGGAMHRITRVSSTEDGSRLIVAGRGGLAIVDGIQPALRKAAAAAAAAGAAPSH